MPKTLGSALSELKGSSVEILTMDSYPEPGKATFQMAFSGGSRLRADYWRVIKDGKERLSSFDHEQQYGLPEPIDAIDELRKELQNKIVADARFHEETGDLLFRFFEGVKLQVFAFSCYEVWELTFPNGATEYSNHAK